MGKLKSILLNKEANLKRQVCDFNWVLLWKKQIYGDNVLKLSSSKTSEKSGRKGVIG